jgi:hypothetical protein
MHTKKKTDAIKQVGQDQFKNQLEVIKIDLRDANGGLPYKKGIRHK